MPSCCFCGRSQVAKVKNEGITFHKFPKEDPTLAAWMEVANQCSSKVKPRSIVCSAHFTEDCFDRFERSVRLKKLAIPTIMIQRVKHAKTLYPEVLMSLDQCNQSSNSSTEQYVEAKTLYPEVLMSLDECNQSSNSSTERYVKVTDVKTSIEGVEEINVDNVDNNIFTNDKICSVNTLVSKKSVKMKTRIQNQTYTTCESASNDSPGRLTIKPKINNYAYQLDLKNKRIKYLNQKVQRQEKSITTMKNVIAELKDNNLLHQG